MTIEDVQRQAARDSLTAAIRALDEGRDMDALQRCGDAAEAIGTVVVYSPPPLGRASAGKGRG